MGRYNRDVKKVEATLLALATDGTIYTTLDTTGAEIKRIITELASVAYIGDIDPYTNNKQMLLSLSDTAKSAITELRTRIATINQEMEAYENAGIGTKALATVGMFLSKLGEGFLDVGEGLVDGFSSIVVELLDWFDGDKNATEQFRSDVAGFIQTDHVGNAFHELNQRSGISKYSAFSEYSGLANITEGFGTMLGYVVLGSHGGIVADLITGYAADLGMSVQSNLAAGADWDTAVEAGRVEAIEGAAFTVVLGGLVKHYTKAGKGVLGQVDEIASKGLGTVDDLDNSVRSMDKSITGFDSASKLDDIGDVTDVTKSGTSVATTPSGKNVYDFDGQKVVASEASNATKAPKGATEKFTYDIVDETNGYKKIGEVEVVTKSDGSVVKTTEMIDPDTGKATTKQVVTADNSGSTPKTTAVETTDYKANTSTEITGNETDGFTKVTKEGGDVVSTEKITVSTDAANNTTTIKTETYDGKLNSDGTPAKGTTKVSDTEEILDTTNNKVTSRTTTEISGDQNVVTKDTQITNDTMHREVSVDGTTQKTGDISVTKNADGNIESVDKTMKSGQVDVSESIEFENGKTKKHTVKSEDYADLDANGRPKSTTTIDEISSSKENIETITRKTTDTTDFTSPKDISTTTVKRTVNPKTGNLVEVTTETVPKSGPKVTEVADSSGTIRQKVTTTGGGQTTVDTLNSQGYYKRTVTDPNGKKTTTILLDGDGTKASFQTYGKLESSKLDPQNWNVTNKISNKVSDVVSNNKLLNRATDTISNSKIGTLYNDITSSVSNKIDEIVSSTKSWMGSHKLTTKMLKAMELPGNHPKITTAAVATVGAMLYGNTDIATMSEQAKVLQTTPNLDTLKEVTSHNAYVDESMNADDYSQTEDGDLINSDTSTDKPSDDKKNTTTNSSDTQTQNRVDTSNNNHSSSTSTDNTYTSTDNKTDDKADDKTDLDLNDDLTPDGENKDLLDQETESVPEDNPLQTDPEGTDTEQPDTQPPTQQEDVTTQPEQQPPSNSTPSYSTPSTSTPPYSTPSYSTPSTSTPTTGDVTGDTTINYEDLEILDEDLDDSLDDLIGSDLLDDSELIDGTDTEEDLYTIPTPIEPTEEPSNGDGGSGVGPILTGLGLAGAAGVGAKIFLDKKKEAELENDEDEEDDEIIADEWNEDNDEFDFMNGDDMSFNYQDQDQEA